MAEPLLYDFRMLASRHEQRGVAVPQVIKPDGRQSGALKYRLEVAVHDILRVEQPAGLIGEDQVLIPVQLAQLQLPLSLPYPVMLEDAEDALANRDDPATAGLGRGDQLAVARAHRCGALDPKVSAIKVRPAESQRLARPNAGEQQDSEERGEAGLVRVGGVPRPLFGLNRSQEPLGLLRGEAPQLQTWSCLCTRITCK